MKALILALCLAGPLLLAGCGDSDGGDGGNNGGNVNNLQSFVVNNCNQAPSGEPANINGGSFPSNSDGDPSQSVYSRNCLQQ